MNDREPNSAGYDPEFTWRERLAEREAAGKGPPGSAQREPGKCGFQLSNSVERYGESRYCVIRAGQRTDHPGFGWCWHHQGNTQKGKRVAGRQQAESEVRSLSERLGRPPPIGDVNDELLSLAAEITEYRVGLRELMGELPTLDLKDAAGVSRMQAIAATYQEMLSVSRDTLVAIKRLGLTEEHIKVKERTAELLGGIMLGLILHPSLGLADEQIDWGRTYIVERLQEVAPILEARNEDPRLRILDAEVVDDE